MRRMRRATAGLVFALAACAPALNWREWRAANLTALLPCKPQHAERSVALAGHSVRLLLDHCDAADATWAVARADVGDPREVDAALRGLRDAALRNVDAGAAAAEASAAVAGMTAHAQARRVSAIGRRPGGAPVELQTVVFAHGTTVWQATVLAPRVDADAAQTFFGALRFVAP